MSAPPNVEIIPRTPNTMPPGEPDRHGDGSPRAAADWDVLERLFLEGSATTWLSVPSPDGVHVRPLFAAWTGSSFVFASNARAAKSRRLDEAGRCSLALDLAEAHVVVEGTVARRTGEAALSSAAATLGEVYGWPTTVVGDELDAPYAAPSSGGPPFRVYEVTPTRAYAFPTDDQFEPTRFTFA